MKDMKFQNENKMLTGAVNKSTGVNEVNREKDRPPLTCKTNKLTQKVQKKIRQTTAVSGGDIADKPGHGQVRFTVRADEETVKQEPVESSAVLVHAQTQTDGTEYGADTAAADMCQDVPSDGYWRQLAESRQSALELTLAENQQLHEQVARMQEENGLLKDVVQQAEDVIASVKEWTAEQDQGTNRH